MKDYDPEADIAGSYAEAIGAIRERVKAGEPLLREGYFAPYQAFLEGKQPRDTATGMSKIPDLPQALKPFQKAVVAWALRRGRAALFEATGLGKTIQQLAWARAVVDEERAPVLILTPLAVAEQTVAEAARFGIANVAYAADKRRLAGITVTNYERFDKFDISRFSGIVLDESGVLKSQDGKTRALLTEACAGLKWRLCCTATPAPNDYTELGQHSEFLGVMRAAEMLAMFFVHDGSIRANADAGVDGWRLKRHAERDFWAWLASWSVMIRGPADLGFDGSEYVLPELRYHQVTVPAEYTPTAGMLFPVEANTLSERIGVRRDSAAARVDAAVRMVDSKNFADTFATCSATQPRSADALRLASDTRPTQSETAPSKMPRSALDNRTPAALISGLTIKQISINGTNGLESSATDTTLPDASDMPPMSSTEKRLNRGRKKSQATSPKAFVTVVTDKSSELLSPITSQCSSSKAGAALFAAPGKEIGPDEISMSITVTTMGLSEVYCAVPATSASANLGTTLCSSNAPRDTSVVIWCHLNSEQQRLEKHFGERCVSVYGSLPSPEKVRRIWSFINGEVDILLTKPSICGHGLNLQFCSKQIMVGLTDSFEELFQAVRRCWRFGQTRPVDVYLIASELEGAVVANLRRKEANFDAMLEAMSGHMRDLMREAVLRGRNATTDYNPTVKMELPQWLTA